MVRPLAAAAADRLAPLWLLVTALGLRRGEALALRWEDVDLEAGHLRVRATLQRVEGRLVRADVSKTQASRRTLPLPAVVVEALRAHGAAQIQDRVAAPVWQDATLVFTTSVGTPLEPQTCSVPSSSSATGRDCAGCGSTTSARGRVIPALRHQAW